MPEKGKFGFILGREPLMPDQLRLAGAEKSIQPPRCPSNYLCGSYGVLQKKNTVLSLDDVVMYGKDYTLRAARVEPSGRAALNTNW